VFLKTLLKDDLLGKGLGELVGVGSGVKRFSEKNKILNLIHLLKSQEEIYHIQNTFC